MRHRWHIIKSEAQDLKPEEPCQTLPDINESQPVVNESVENTTLEPAKLPKKKKSKVNEESSS